jgi:uncharacterized protein (DUF1697 family)
MEPPHRTADGRQRRLSRHVALLRGINVGGRNPVPMADLRDTLEADGFTSVQTYIQSGNVVFDTTRPATGLEDHIESLLEARFGYPIVVVVRSRAQMRAIVAAAPPGFGTDPATYHSDVIVLKAPLTSAQAVKVVSLKPDVDRVWPGKGVVYFDRLSARRTESRLSKIMGTPEYRLMTVRNWNTTTKLVDLLG